MSIFPNTRHFAWSTRALSDEEVGPFIPDETTRALWKRAIADPSSLSDKDRRTVFRRVSRKEEDSRFRALCGLSIPELTTKAIQDTGSLSYDEACLIITPNVDFDTLEQRSRMKDEIAARIYSLDIESFWDKQNRAARAALSDTDTQIIYAMVFYSKGVNWPEFKEQIEAAMQPGSITST
ncbi:hypothetical protein F53441_5178 [Fusarium austroafricanum]|uniref:Uncharacterized protein n=1 Tax=Fusarium austroafricanum TaxID=2364996 RepID=A0A8H4NUL9_9HYPO|nr:hypothetical protein F53441_5178 [Fusarium austroafricanum]